MLETYYLYMLFFIGVELSRCTYTVDYTFKPYAQSRHSKKPSAADLLVVTFIHFKMELLAKCPALKDKKEGFL